MFVLSSFLVNVLFCDIAVWSKFIQRDVSHLQEINGEKWILPFFLHRSLLQNCDTCP